MHCAGCFLAGQRRFKWESSQKSWVRMSYVFTCMYVNSPKKFARVDVFVVTCMYVKSLSQCVRIHVFEDIYV